MGMGVWIVALFAVIFLFYINSFLIKRRTREFGLYNILGLEKRHIGKIIGFETLYSFIISMLFGIGAGIILDKLMYLIILKMLDASIQWASTYQAPPSSFLWYCSAQSSF